MTCATHNIYGYFATAPRPAYIYFVILFRSARFPLLTVCCYCHFVRAPRPSKKTIDKRALAVGMGMGVGVGVGMQSFGIFLVLVRPY